jgi:uncharacterized protein YcbX
MTTGSLRSLQELTPGSRADVRRFRPNVLIATPDDADDPFPEESWVGRKVACGSAVFEVSAACPRCVMITHAVDDLPTDRAILRTVIRHAHQNLGVYATVVTPGEIAIGDEVRLLD